MGWMQKCYETYNNNVGSVKNIDEKEPLCPVAHISATAQLEITLNMNGDFVRAVEIDKSKGRILIPVTENSSGRSSGIAPHALYDTLPYLAGDYGDYVGNDNEKKKARDKYNAYRIALYNWCHSQYSCEKIETIYRYIEKSIMIHDLVKCGIVTLENGKFSSKKISGQSYDKVLVRFRVMGGMDSNDEVWRDKEVINKYIDYYCSLLPGKEDICYVKGNKVRRATSHPKGIVASQYGAKLVSANDSTDFTYRGRFFNSDEAYAVGYDVSQKVHNALRWIVANQGVTIGTKDNRSFVCWNPGGKNILSIYEDNPFYQDVDEDIPYTAQEYKKKLYKTLVGYKFDISDDNDGIVVMALDAATTGRLSITYYNELTGSDYYQRVQEWYSSCIWEFDRFSKDKKHGHEIRTPSMKEIVKYAYGTEDDKNQLVINDKLYKEQMQRMVKCMLDMQPFPRDIVHKLYIKASMPQNYSFWGYNKLLSVACAAITKRKYDEIRNSRGIISKEQEENMLQLDLNNDNRSYLFGRLLAVLEDVERRTYSIGETREPNAIRYQTAFVHHPMQTWHILEELINPYIQKIGSFALRKKYKDLIQSILQSFREEDLKYMNQTLDENYLIGYYLQRADMKNALKNYKDNNENTQE